MYNRLLILPTLHSRTYFFFFNDTATTEIYTLSLHDALPIFHATSAPSARLVASSVCRTRRIVPAHNMAAMKRFGASDRKSTRLNSSHANISYAVFCLKKKKKKTHTTKIQNRKVEQINQKRPI